MPKRTVQPEIIQISNDTWWTGVLQGALAIFFGILALVWPGLTLLTLVYLFGGFVLAMGVIEAVAGLMNIEKRGTWWITLVIGLIGAGIGIFLLRNPTLSFKTFVFITGIALIARGLLDFVRALVDEASPSGKALSVIIGIAAMTAGILLFLQPLDSAIALVWVLGLYALVIGPLIMAVALGLRRALDA